MVTISKNKISDDVFDVDEAGNESIDVIRDENSKFYSEREKFEPFNFDRININNKKRR